MIYLYEDRHIEESKQETTHKKKMMSVPGNCLDIRQEELKSISGKFPDIYQE